MEIPEIIKISQCLSFRLNDIRNLSTNMCYSVCNSRMMKKKSAREWTERVRGLVKENIGEWKKVNQPVEMKVTFYQCPY